MTKTSLVLTLATIFLAVAYCAALDKVGAAPTTSDPPVINDQQVASLRIASAYACGLMDGKGVFNAKRPRACDDYRETARKNGIAVPTIPRDPVPSQTPK